MSEDKIGDIEKRLTDAENSANYIGKVAAHAIRQNQKLEERFAMVESGFEWIKDNQARLSAQLVHANDKANKPFWYALGGGALGTSIIIVLYHVMTRG